MTAPNQAIPQTIYDHDFVRLAKSASHPREKIRFLAFSHLKDGKKPSEVADIVRVARNSLYHWLRRFREKGLEGLREQGGRGKKPLIPEEEREAFRCAVLELQAGRDGGSITGKDVLRLMEEKYGIKCSLKSAYNQLKKASLVWISARSRHPKSDLKKQEEFKKNSKSK
ncbi:MAG: winged helix-turn-helix domain-containing protein [Chlamydiales bacterium]|nr:winged helix-turn-helix domain-containing protein [Chlamydiales bacterium]